MSKPSCRLAVAGILAALLVSSCAPRLIPSGWALLGRREVNFSIDRDTITVPRGLRAVNRLAVIAKMNPVEIYDIRIEFDSGAAHETRMRERLFPGRDRLFIDLPGGTRIVRQVSFRYRTLNNAARRAMVEVWGN